MSVTELAIPFASSGDVLAAGIVLPVMGILAVSLRFWMRSVQHVGLQWDDYLILFALPFVIGMGVCLIYGVERRVLGYPSPPLPDASPETELTQVTPEQSLVELPKLDWIIWCIMVPANGLIKLSAAFLYRRIFVVNKWSPFDVVTKVAILTVIVWTVAFLFAELFGCGTHFTYPWSALLYISQCDTNKRLDALMISDLITDVIIWLLPMPMIWGLQMARSRKLSMTGIFLLAAVSLAAAIVRLLVQLQISNGGYAAHTDVNLTLTNLLYWSMIESSFALVAACLPTLHKLYARSTLRRVVSNIQSAIAFSSLRSNSSSRALKSADGSELETGKGIIHPSHRDKYEGEGDWLDSGKARGIEFELGMPLVLMKPNVGHTKHGK